jgi:hypothetical protein
MNTIGVEREAIQRDAKGRLAWDGDDTGELGFPVPDWKKE